MLANTSDARAVKATGRKRDRLRIVVSVERAAIDEVAQLPVRTLVLADEHEVLHPGLARFDLVVDLAVLVNEFATFRTFEDDLEVDHVPGLIVDDLDSPHLDALVAAG